MNGLSESAGPEPFRAGVVDPAGNGKGRRPGPIAWAWLLIPLGAVLILHLAVLGRYGIGWDELYYVACADHLDWGYVDHPPLVAAIVAAARSVLGDSLPALRFPGLVAGLTSALVAGLIARELGAGRFGQLLACLCVTLAPGCAAIRHTLSMNPFDHLFWTLALLLTARILGRGEPRLWPLFGLVVGIGILNKYSIGFFCAALGLGLLLTPARRHLADRRFWLGAAIAVVIVLPHVAWQMRHDWASLEFMRNVSTRKNLPLSLLEFWRASVVMMNPLTVPIWAAGLGFLLLSRRGRPYRALGFVYPVLLVVFQANHGKPYYLVPTYFSLFAAGACFAESRAGGRPWARAALVSIVVVPFLIACPLFLPVLHEEALVRYQARLGLLPRAEERGHAPTQLPVIFASMLGFEDRVRAVARVYRALPEGERAATAIFGAGYGNAAAVDYFGPRYGLPKAIGGHNSYWLWGPRGYTGEVVITIGAAQCDLEGVFEEVRLVEVVNSPYAQDRDVAVHLCRRMKLPMSVLWPRVRVYI